MKYIDNLNKIFNEIEKSRVKYSPHHIVKIVAISKYVDANEIKEMYQAGQRAFGENKVQDLIKKQKELQDLPIEWHFVGRIQTNKINALIDADVALVHSIDSLKTAIEFQKRLEKKNKIIKALLQINGSSESSKAGVSLELAKKLYHEIESSCPNIILKGYMSIGANSDNMDIVKDSFVKVRDIFNGTKNAYILSMGMSNDYKIAIENGSNLIRIGSALF